MVDILARLKIRAEEFSRGARTAFGDFERQAGQAGDRAGQDFARGLNARLDALATGATVTAIAAVGQRALEHVAGLKKESQQLGINTQALQEYRFAAAEVGVEQDALSDTFTELTQKIGEARAGNKEASQAFKDIGIDIESASGRGKSMASVFDELIGRMSQVQDPTQRARLEAQLLGDQWQKIDPMLHAGASRIDELRKSAHELGAVISDEAIQNADETARKLEQMKMVLEANIADAVAKNSTAILGMANSFTRLAGGIATFWQQNPEKAYGLVGAAGGARIGFALGGVQGAAIGAGAGYVAGSMYGQSEKYATDDANMDLAFRRKQLANARAELAASKRAADSNSLFSFRRTVSERSVGSVQTAEQEVMRQAKLLWRAAQPKMSLPGPPTFDPITPTASNKGGGSSRASGGGRGSGGISDEQRAIESARKEEERLRDSLDDTIQRQQDSARIARIRAEQGDLIADREKALLDLARQFPALEDATVQTLMDKFHITEDQAKADLERYETLKKIAVEEVNADAARKQAAEDAKARADAERKAQEELDRMREEAAEQQRRSMEDLSRYYYDLFSGNAGNIWQDFKREGTEVISMLAAQWTIAMLTGQKFDVSSALGGMSGLGGYGGPATTLISSLLNGRGRGSDLASAAAAEGGTAEQIAAAAKMSKSLGSTSQQLGSLNKYLAGIGAGQAVSGLAGAIGVRQSSTAALAGSVIGTAIGGPLGGAIGGLISGTIGGLLKKTKRGSVSLNIEDGQAAVGDAYGNSASYRRNAKALGGGVADQLNSIADALGVDLTGRASVSIGQRKDKFVVDTTGQRRTKGSGTLSFDTEEEAIEAAVRDALRDGVLGPISDASKRILTSGQDLDKALQKALAIESIPKALKARLDPVGYAIDQLNDKWADTIKALKEGGATAEQMAQAQQLYNLELEDVKTNTADAAQSLKAFLSAMNAGSASPLSLRDQEQAAQAALAPYLDKINRGQSIDQDAYQSAAQTFLDIERQLYGSTSKFFEAFDAIQAATSTAIGTIDNAAPIRTTSDVFNETTATASQATAANTANTNSLLQKLIEQQQQLAALLGSQSSFLGTSRNF